MSFPIRATERLSPEAHEHVRRRAIFDCDKWDPQVGDVSVIAPWALVVPESAVTSLFRRTERMAEEILAIERELADRPDLWATLGFTGPSGAALGAALLRARWKRRASVVIDSPRVSRFDFHPVEGGLALSEVNTDVPGGYNEASGLTALVLEAMADGALASTGDPAGALASALASRARGETVALVHATAYADDRQVMAYLARRLTALGLDSIPMSPEALTLDRGGAHASGRAIGAVMRFFPAEWLSSLPMRSRWWRFFAEDVVAQVNPGTAILTQTKRWPLVMSRLRTRAPELLDALGETEAPTAAHVDSSNGAWVLKPALGRVGDHVGVPGASPLREWVAIAHGLRRAPHAWVAQRRFHSRAIETPDGPRHVCIGVYVVDGRAVGCYGRAAWRGRIDGAAQEVAVLSSKADA